MRFVVGNGTARYSGIEAYPVLDGRANEGGTTTRFVPFGRARFLFGNMPFWHKEEENTWE